MPKGRQAATERTRLLSAEQDIKSRNELFKKEIGAVKTIDQAKALLDQLTGSVKFDALTKPLNETKVGGSKQTRDNINELHLLIETLQVREKAIKSAEQEIKSRNELFDKEIGNVKTIEQASALLDKLTRPVPFGDVIKPLKETRESGSSQTKDNIDHLRHLIDALLQEETKKNVEEVQQLFEHNLFEHNNDGVAVLNDGVAVLNEPEKRLQIDLTAFDSHGRLTSKARDKMKKLEVTNEQMNHIETLHGIQKCMEAAPLALQESFPLIKTTIKQASLSNALPSEAERTIGYIHFHVQDAIEKIESKRESLTSQSKLLTPTWFESAVQFCKQFISALQSKEKTPLFDRFKQIRAMDHQHHSSLVKENEDQIAKHEEKFGDAEKKFKQSLKVLKNDSASTDTVQPDPETEAKPLFP